MIYFKIKKIIDDDTIQISVKDVVLTCHYSNYNNLNLSENNSYAGQLLAYTEDNIKTNNTKKDNQITQIKFWSYFVVGIYKREEDEYLIKISQHLSINVDNELLDLYLGHQVELKIDRLDLIIKTERLGCGSNKLW